VSITGWTRACLFSPRRCPADGLPSLNDLGTCGPNASVEKLRMFDLSPSRAILTSSGNARNRASARETWRTLSSLTDASRPRAHKLFLRFHEPFNEQAFRFLEPLRGRKVPESYKLRSARSDGQSGARPNHELDQAVWRASDSAFPYHEAVWRRATEAGR
jgi:hypothetical protein